MEKISSVCVLGLGYIGLPTAATIASRGVDVVGVDVKNSVVDRLNAGEAHFAEADLDSLLSAAVINGKLRGALVPEAADVFIIAVPTPFLDNKNADLSYVEAATREIAKVLEPGNLLILESTSPVGTTAAICKWIEAERPELKAPTNQGGGDFHVAYCPERILPGRMVFELVENDRVIGGISSKCSARAAELYSLFVRGELLFTSAGVAELVKLIENAYRDVNIAFANELSMVCEKLDLDVWEAINLANRHPRVNILNPGAGVGGHCIAVDPWFLISAEPELTPLMRTARDVNDTKPEFVLSRVRNQLERYKTPVVACLGISYKPDIDDLRESPALLIAEKLASEGVELIIVEPNIEELPESLSSATNVSHATLGAALDQADIILLLVGHSQFKKIEHSRVLRKSVIDTVGML
jgi:UDP-N-acetyl-D-mannosaminuronic acid dehydrogenase